LRQAHSDPVAEGIRILSDNRSAGHNYHLLDRFEAGLALTGTEVKAAREGKVQLRDAFGEVVGNEAWLVNAHISQYAFGNRENHEPNRRRKLLLHRKEIDKLLGQTREKGLTLVPTKMYLKNGRVKLELAVARGKKLHDKREAAREREMDAEARGAMSRARRRE
jgi:SsrA-binding protein